MKLIKRKALIPAFLLFLTALFGWMGKKTLITPILKSYDKDKESV